MTFHLFSRLGGDSPQLLDECSEKERINSSILAMTLLIPMTLWFIGGWATAWMMQAPPIGCGIAGGVCAASIGVLDRGMMAYLSRKGRSVFGLLARLILAVSASLVFAHPAVFLLANGILDREIEAAQNQIIESRKSEIGPELGQARQRVATNISALREAAMTAEAAWKVKDGELRESRAGTAKSMKEADDEARGLRGSPRGESTDYRRAMSIVAANQMRETTVAAEAESALKQMESARSDLRDALSNAAKDAEVVRLERDIDIAATAIRAQNHGDPFSRFEALHRLILRDWKEGKYSLGIAYIVVCVVLLGLELVPLGFKLGSRGGEHSLKVEALQFKAEQDFENLRQVYPALSMQTMQLRLEAEAQKESLRLGHDVIMDSVRAHRCLARSTMLEKAEVFEMAEDVMKRVPKKARPEHREFAERLAKQLIDGFLASIESALKRVHPQGAGEGPASASPVRG